MGFGLDKCLLDNYLFTFTIAIALSNAFHVPSSMAILLHRYSRWSLRSWFFPYRSLNLFHIDVFLSNLPDKSSRTVLTAPCIGSARTTPENISLLSNGYHVLLSGVSTHALPTSGRPILLDARWLEHVYVFVS
jgi:hypothetical protein